MCAIIISFIPELLPNIFNDTICTAFDKYKCSEQYERCIGNQLHWSYRHWILFIMGICLTLVQIGKIICLMEKEIND